MSQVLVYAKFPKSVFNSLVLFFWGGGEINIWRQSIYSDLLTCFYKLELALSKVFHSVLRYLFIYNVLMFLGRI